MKTVEFRRHSIRGEAKDLSPYGIQLAREAKRSLAEAYALVLTSPKRRCRQTVEAFGFRRYLVEEAVRQVLVHAHYLADRETGLWFHGSTFAGDHNFARARWARGNAWITVGILELMDLATIGEPERGLRRSGQRPRQQDTRGGPAGHGGSGTAGVATCRNRVGGKRRGAERRRGPGELFRYARNIA